MHICTSTARTRGFLTKISFDLIKIILFLTVMQLLNHMKLMKRSNITNTV